MTDEKKIEEGSVPSPYKVATVTAEMLEQIRTLVGCKSIFIAVSDEDSSHKCTDECQGHMMNINVCGFSNSQIVGIAKVIADSANLELVPKVPEEGLSK
jgi:hypothetical protein